MNREKPASDIMQSIGEILLNDWDPIGIRDVPEALDEYEDYIGEIYRLLASGVSEEVICNHLAQIEEKLIGLEPTDRQNLRVVAQKLMNLNVCL